MPSLTDRLSRALRRALPADAPDDARGRARERVRVTAPLAGLPADDPVAADALVAALERARPDVAWRLDWRSGVAVLHAGVPAGGPAAAHRIVSAALDDALGRPGLEDVRAGELALR